MNGPNANPVPGGRSPWFWGVAFGVSVSAALRWAARILLGIVIAKASAVAAQVPFPCTGDLYQVQSGQLRIFDTQTSTYVDVGPQQPGYNSLAYNPVDSYFYATQSNNIIRIDATGALTVEFAIGFNTVVGDIGDNNLMYLRFDKDTLAIVDLVTQQQTNVPLSQRIAGGAADWAFVDTPQGRRLIAPGRTSLSLIDPDTGQNDVVAIANYPDEGSAGATWSDANGRVFTFRNTTGNVYEILDYLTPTPSAVLIAVGDPSSSNDGTNCRLAPFPNFPPIAFDDEFTTRFETALDDENIILGSGNGVDNDPDGGPVLVEPTLIQTPNNGTVTFDPDGSFVYTPDAGFSGLDTFIYEISDLSGLSAQALVSITVTSPVIEVEKQSAAIDTSGTVTFYLPGNEVVYSIAVSNTGNQEVDTDGLFLVDTWPIGLEFNTLSEVTWSDNASGLDFDYERDVAFSNGGTQPTDFTQCTYEPVGPYDPDVRYICIKPAGALLPSGSATFSLSGRIN